MATLVLTAVGTAVGGPIGGAIGAAIGQPIDRDMLFKPAGRQGPRLTELAVQTSTYGRQIPQLFGTMRVAGSVIWATDLVEHRHRDGGGKGRPATTTYSYSASFAVALSGRRITRVGRIWADGSLLRGAAGDWKVACGFRLHDGGEDQLPDPLIASAEGAAAPAHRGIAYAVFEGLALEEFGNRIPSLSFEVVADEAAPTIGAVAAAIGAPVLRAEGASLAIDGFSAHGDSARAAIEALAEAGGAWFGPRHGGIAIREEAGEPVAIAAGDAARAVRALPAEAVPRHVTVRHYDPARDWQAGVQRAARPGPGHRVRDVEVPAALSAPAAKRIAQTLLARAEQMRTTRRVTSDSAALAVRPGDVVTVDGEAGRWRVTQAAVERMRVTLDLVPVAAVTPPAGASGGRVLGAVDRPAGATILHVFETPPLDDTLPTKPRLTIVAAGTGAGWRRASLLYSVDDGASWIAAGGTAAPGVVGYVIDPPGAAPATIEDRRHAIEVELAHDAMALVDADRAAIDRGANLVLVGDELIQFARAERLAPRRWRVSVLRRARRGMAGVHAVGERFVLLDAASAATIDVAAAPGTPVRVMAAGAGDGDVPTEATIVLSGAAMLPPAPVALRAHALPDGAAALGWRRRTRAGWAWRDGIDMPLGEEREAYRVTVTTAAGATRVVDGASATVTIAPGERAGGPVRVAVRQIGTHGASPAATIDI